MPAANHSFYLRNCYLENRLPRATMEIDGVKLDLKKVTMPIYNLATREDHIAPAQVGLSSARPSSAGRCDSCSPGSGHIAGVVNPPAKQQVPVLDRAEARRATTSTRGSRARHEHPGSWWPDWVDWIKSTTPPRSPARKPGGGKLKPIEDAPGSYVKNRAIERAVRQYVAGLDRRDMRWNHAGLQILH